MSVRPADQWWAHGVRMHHPISGTELPFTMDGGVVSFEAGQFAAYDVVAIEVA